MYIIQKPLKLFLCILMELGLNYYWTPELLLLKDAEDSFRQARFHSWKGEILHNFNYMYKLKKYRILMKQIFMKWVTNVKNVYF